MFGATNESLSKEYSDLMSKEFEMSMMGELTFFLGLQIKKEREGIFIKQGKYVRDLLKKYNLDQSKPSKTPMSSSCSLDQDLNSKSKDQKLYRGMIGSLLYLTASRPYIMFSVGVCARFQVNPKDSHLMAVKRTFRYLNGTRDLGLWYPNNSDFSLVGYSDSYFTGYKVDRKSTTGNCQFLGSSPISWQLKKQHSVALSSAEAEYIVAGACCAQILWMSQQLRDLELDYREVPIKCDNTSAISITKNPVQHSHTKHIDVRPHFIRDHYNNKDITIGFIPTQFQIADIFTKLLSEDRFNYLVSELGMLNKSAQT